MRRKMVHYIDDFTVVEGVDGVEFQLTAPYLWVHYAFPEQEMQILDKRVEDALVPWEHTKEEGMYSLGDLVFSIDTRKPPLDTQEFPSDYVYRSYTLKKIGSHISSAKLREPWDVLRTGIRTPDVPETPIRLKSAKEILPFLPAHLELGCGPSIEAGVPPLHYLHDVFGITESATGKFTLDVTKDALVTDILRNPSSFYAKSSLPYQRALLAPLTDFYVLMCELHDTGKILDPVITNNFDGIPSLLGMKEKYLRRYSESEIIPKIAFDKRAKALIVVGSHADRRRTQASAREAGLHIIYVDPEGFADTGRAYSLEAPRSGDMVLNMTAQQFAAELKMFLGEQGRV
jgi:hypothetical protein